MRPGIQSRDIVTGTGDEAVRGKTVGSRKTAEAQPYVDEVPEGEHLRGMNSLPKGITVLLPYYLHVGFKHILEAMGYDVVWADNASYLIKMLEGHHVDIAIEWQHGPNCSRISRAQTYRLTEHDTSCCPRQHEAKPQ
jgi:hypothetical protein